MRFWFDTLLVVLVIVLFLLAFASMSRTNAHDWYDPYCCNNNDCAPVEQSNLEFSTGPDGEPTLTVTTKAGKVTGLMKDISIRPSKDEQYHVCIIVYHGVEIRCLYVPAGG